MPVDVAHNEKTRPRVLIALGLSSRQLGAAGPVQSLSALMRDSREEFDFFFLSDADRHLAGCGDSPLAQWVVKDGIHYFWARPGQSYRGFLRNILASGDWHLVMLNSFFDRHFTLPALLFKRLGIVPRVPIILSPRGEFAASALSIKPVRKKLFLTAARLLGLLKDVWLHATADHERADAAALRLGDKGILDAPDTASLAPAPANLAARSIEPGSLRLAFVGRISRVKNIHFALDILAETKVPVCFDVYGPLEDLEYWDRCEAKIAQLPPHIEVRRLAPVPNDKVVSILSDYDLFLFPSLGENFGHVIHEALSAGLPVLISDTTPWHGLEAAQAGWDLPLDDPQPFVNILEHYAGLDADTRRMHRFAARQFAEQKHAERAATEMTKTMFWRAIEAHREEV